MDQERRNAFQEGKPKYVSRKPCKFGHEPLRYTKTGSCVHCNYERNRNIRQKYLNFRQGFEDLILQNIRKDHIPLIQKYAKALEDAYQLENNL